MFKQLLKFINEQEYKPEDAYPSKLEKLDKLDKFIQKFNLTKNSDGTYSTEEDVDLSGKKLEKLPCKFRKVGGDFYCSYNDLTSLEGAPEEVGGSFFCSHNKLTSLEGAPKKVGRGFFCSYNKLTSLEGVPEEVGGSFGCSNNELSPEELKKTVERDYL